LRRDRSTLKRLRKHSLEVLRFPTELLESWTAIEPSAHAGFRPAPDRLQGTMPLSERLPLQGIDGAPLLWRRGKLRAYGAATPAGILQGLTIQVTASKPLASFLEHDPQARNVVLSDGGLRTIRYGNQDYGLVPRIDTGRQRTVRRQRLPGKTLLAGGFWPDCNNYFHFWTDVIGDLWFLRENGIDLDAADRILMPWNGKAWQREIADLCGLDPAKILPLSEADFFRPVDLTVPVRLKGGVRNPDWLATAMRTMSAWEAPAERREPGRRLYATRGNALRRPLRNEAEVIAALEPMGFEVVDCGRISVRAQRTLFAEAGILVGPHGAAFTNLVWAGRGTKLVDLIPRGLAHPCFHDLAQQAEVVYRAVPASWEDPAFYPVWAGYKVDPQEVLAVVRSLL